MAISPQQLTIYLYSAHRAVTFAIAQLSCYCRRRQEKRTCLSYLWTDTPGPIPTKFGMRVVSHDLIKLSNFCNKFSGLQIYRGSKSPFSHWLFCHRYTTVMRYLHVRKSVPRFISVCALYGLLSFMDSAARPCCPAYCLSLLRVLVFIMDVNTGGGGPAPNILLGASIIRPLQ